MRKKFETFHFIDNADLFRGCARQSSRSKYVL